VDAIVIGEGKSLSRPGASGRNPPALTSVPGLIVRSMTSSVRRRPSRDHRAEHLAAAPAGPGAQVFASITSCSTTRHGIGHQSRVPLHLQFLSSGRSTTGGPPDEARGSFRTSLGRTEHLTFVDDIFLLNTAASQGRDMIKARIKLRYSCEAARQHRPTPDLVESGGHRAVRGVVGLEGATMAASIRQQEKQHHNNDRAIEVLKATRGDLGPLSSIPT